MSDIQELVLSLAAWEVLAAATLFPIAGFWLLCLRGKPLWPPRRTRLVSWTGFEIFVILLLNEIIIPALVLDCLRRIHFFTWVYGSDLDPNGDSLATARLGLWLMVISFPLQFITVLGVLGALSRTRPYQIGLTTAAAGRNLVVGWLGWLALTPAVLIINYLVIYGLTFWLREPVQTHPIMRLVEKQPLALEWLLILFSALVAAPVMEELFYRGVLQPWFSSRSWGGWAAIIAALLVALLPWASKLTDGGGKGQPLFVHEDLEPAFFVVLMIPFYLLAPRLVRTWIPAAADAQAVFGTALLFAMRHANVWPTPIPLFILALGLGYVTYRTRSLVPSILWHSLFNGVNFVPLLLTSGSG